MRTGCPWIHSWIKHTTRLTNPSEWWAQMKRVSPCMEEWMSDGSADMDQKRQGKKWWVKDRKKQVICGRFITESTPECWEWCRAGDSHWGGDSRQVGAGILSFHTPGLFPPDSSLSGGGMLELIPEIWSDKVKTHLLQEAVNQFCGMSRPQLSSSSHWLSAPSAAHGGEVHVQTPGQRSTATTGGQAPWRASFLYICTVEPVYNYIL